MKLFKSLSILIVSIMFSCNSSTDYKYPSIVKDPIIEEFYGQKIEDPYRNLEDLEDSIVVSWLKDQNKLANTVFGKINGRERLIEMQQLFEKKNKASIRSVRITENGRHFFLKQKPNEAYSKLYYRSDFKAVDSLIFDPTNFKNEDNTNYSINYIKPDWLGDKVAISLSKEGEELSELVIVNLVTKEKIYDITSNSISSSVGGISWLPDNSGIIYQHAPLFKNNDPEYLHNTSSVLYKINKNKKDSLTLFSKSNNPEIPLKEEDFPLTYYKNKNDPYLFGEISGSTPYKDTYYYNFNESSLTDINWKLLFKKQEKISKYFFKDDSITYLTAKNASNFKICRTSVVNPNFLNPEILVPPKKDEVITDFVHTKDGLFYVILKNGVTANLYNYKNGKEKKIEFPRSKSFGRIAISSSGSKSKYLNIRVSGWTSPKKSYLYDYRDNIFIENNLFAGGLLQEEFKNLIVQELEVESHDGIKVPLSIIRNPDLNLDHSNPTFIWGYGSYGISYRPTFNISLLTWVKAGGILAIAHVRGGGEKGNDWYEDGIKTNKPNTWKDAIACTEFLIKEGYTSKEKTIIFGSSAGGIMMGRAVTERPDLFKAAIGDVPAMNMLRCEIQPYGLNSIKEFGTVKDSIGFKALLEMDSYHHIKDNIEYPATLILSGYKDSRVVAWDPAKFVARLQERNKSNNPILFSIDFESGHSVRNNKLKTYQKFASFYAFAFWQTGHPEYQPKE